MKKILFFILVTLPMVVFGQEDVTLFMGIPVDGTKSVLMQKLEKKGFKKAPIGKSYDMYGEFNGGEVELTIVTYKEKVWRVVVCDKHPSNESNIKIKFNYLVSQFSDNSKYVSQNFEKESYYIDEDENISYNMIVHKKRYQAAYYQNIDVNKIDTLGIKNEIMEVLVNKYGKDVIESASDEAKKEAINLSVEYTAKLLAKKSVWFMISNRQFDDYYIVLYYDNEYNHNNNNEDL